MALLFGEGFALLMLRDQAMRRGMTRTEGFFRRGVGRLQSIARGAQLGTLLGAGLGGLTLTGFLAASVKTAVSFEYAMAKVKALIGATDEDMDRLADTARGLGRSTMFSAKQAAQAMYMLARAGFSVDQIIRAMTPTLNLAAAGELEMGQAADMVARIMSGMKLDASELEHAVDVLVTAFTTANTDLEQLTQGLKFVGPIAKNLGMSFEETVAIIQMFQDAGLQGGMAGRSLQQILARLAGGMPEVTKKLEAMGIETADASGRFRGFVPILADFRRHLSRLPEVEQTAKIMELFGARAGPAMTIALAEGSDKLQQYVDRLAAADGKSQQFADTVMNTTQGAVYELKSAVEALEESLGKQLIPTLVEVINYFREMATAAEESGENLFDPSTWFEPGRWLPAEIARHTIGPVLRLLGVPFAREPIPTAPEMEKEFRGYVKEAGQIAPTAYQQARFAPWGRKTTPARMAQFQAEIASQQRVAAQPVNITRRDAMLRAIRRQKAEMAAMWTAERLMEAGEKMPEWLGTARGWLARGHEQLEGRRRVAGGAVARALGRVGGELGNLISGWRRGLAEMPGITATMEPWAYTREPSRRYAGGRLPGAAFGPGTMGRLLPRPPLRLDLRKAAEAVLPGAPMADMGHIFERHGSLLIDLTRTTKETAAKPIGLAGLVEAGKTIMAGGRWLADVATAVTRDREPTRPSRFYGLEEFGRSLQERIGAKEDKQYEKRIADATEEARQLLGGVKTAVKAVEAKIHNVMTMD